MWTGFATPTGAGCLSAVMHGSSPVSSCRGQAWRPRQRQGTAVAARDSIRVTVVCAQTSWPDGAGTPCAFSTLAIAARRWRYTGVRRHQGVRVMQGGSQEPLLGFTGLGHDRVACRTRSAAASCDPKIHRSADQGHARPCDVVRVVERSLPSRRT